MFKKKKLSSRTCTVELRKDRQEQAIISKISQLLPRWIVLLYGESEFGLGSDQHAGGEAESVQLQLQRADSSSTVLVPNSQYQYGL